MTSEAHKAIADREKKMLEDTAEPVAIKRRIVKAAEEPVAVKRRIR